MKKRKLKLRFFIGILLLILALLLIAFMNHDGVCFEKKCFRVEKVSTPEDRARGLMFRYSMSENKGMLFIFENESTYSFWMKNTYIPLDMIWISGQNKVVFIYRNATPCKETCPSIVPSANAKYVLEINAGLADRYSIDVGDEVKIK